MIRTLEINKDIADFIKRESIALLPNWESYGYYRTPWIKLDRGSAIAEIFAFEKDYPEDLQNMMKVDDKMMKVDDKMMEDIK